MCQLELSLCTGNSGPELITSAFTNSYLNMTFHCVRGKGLSMMSGQTGTFNWSSAVKAVTTLMVGHALSQVQLSGADNSEFGTLSGFQGSLASSLDYAITKQPVWLLDMFGGDAKGRCYIRRIIARHNSERKRPGPVTLFVKQTSLANGVNVRLDGKPLDCFSSILHLYESLRGNLEKKNDTRFKFSDKKAIVSVGNESTERTTAIFSNI